MLKQADGYLSGEKIGEEMGISRGGVWKQIKKLRDQGYEIQSVSNRGYCLVEQQELWNDAEIKDGLQTKKLGQEVVFLEQVTSTNEKLINLAREGGKEGLLVVSEIQTAGRGRRGKNWSSPKGTGIWMSLLLKPDLPPVKAPMITLLAGLAICKSIRKVTGLLATIKWPNDILIDGKKICGILTEMDGEMEQIHHIVLGMGINVNMDSFPNALKDIATSLFLETGELVSRRTLIQEILLELEEIYTSYESKGDFEGKTIVIQMGSTAQEALDNNADFTDSLKEVRKYSNNVEALLDLKAGRIEGVVLDGVVGRYYIAENKADDDYRVLSEDLGKESYGVGLRQEDAAFLAELNKALEEMKEDGTAADISKKWFGEDIVVK